MKRIFFITVLLSVFSIIHAQNELEFNQVVYEELSIDTTFTSCSNCSAYKQINIIVPNNKTLKVENISIYNNLYSKIFWNDLQITNFNFPMWLSEGTYVLKVGGEKIGSTSNYPIKGNAILTGIEFNITQ